MTLRRVWIPTTNNSARLTSVRLIVVHTTEGAASYQSLGSFFQGTQGGPNPVSSHVGTDDTPGVVGEYVKRDRASWTVSAFNPVAVNNELCAFAAWTATEWASHPSMLENCAQWIAEESAALGIPIVKLTPAQAQGSSAGVCGHVDLGAPGGGHHDPGPSFPWSAVIQRAQQLALPKEALDLGALTVTTTPAGFLAYAGIDKNGNLIQYVADSSQQGTPANTSKKTWSCYNLTASAANGQPLAP